MNGLRCPSRHASRPLGAAAGFLLDRVFGELPAQWHPLVKFGNLMNHVEQRCWSDSAGAGALYAGVGNTVALVSGMLIGSVPLATWLCCGGRELEQAALAVGGALEVGALEDARRLVTALVGRDPSGLDTEGLAAAVVESLAENTVDAVIAPLFWAALGGSVGTVVHRAIDTLDSLVGYRSARYARFGTVSARLDDAAAFLPARLTGLLVAMVRPQRRAAIWRAVRRDAPWHPSPNAGVAEAAFAGALGLRLGGTSAYGGTKTPRPFLGEGRPAGPSDIEAAIALAFDVALAFVALLVLLGAFCWEREPSPLAKTGPRR